MPQYGKTGTQSPGFSIGISRNIKAGWSWSGFERSRFFVNNGSARFESISEVLGADQVGDGRAYISVDYDMDGDLDLIGTNQNHPSIYALRNDFPAGRHWLMVDLRAAGGLPSVGATIRATAGGRTQRRDVSMGSGYLSQQWHVQHFGLADEATVDRLEITWPGGEVQVLENLAADRHLIVRQGSAEVEEVPLHPRNHSATASMPRWEPDSEPGRLKGLSRRHMARNLTFQGPGGRRVKLSAKGGTRKGPLLVNLWATWCTSCKVEMPELSQLNGSGPGQLSVVGISLDEDAADLDIEKVARQWGADFPVGWMNERQRQRVEELMVELRGERTFRLPTSLLLLEDGSVGAYIEGPIELDEVQDYLDYLGGRL